MGRQMHIKTIASTACAAACLLAAGCGDPTPNANADAGRATAQARELPPIAVQPGDGLPQALPVGLVWETNDADPVFASAEARRGGTFRTYMPSFPLTLRRVGPDSNSGIYTYLRYNQFGLVSFHPETRNPIPAIATHWAFGDDGRSMYFKLNPDARWSDGVPITADDFIYAVQFMRSQEIVAPWYNNFYTERIRDAKRYDDYTIGIQGANPKPREEMLYEYAFGPQPRHFHVLTDNWVAEYNWKIEPNTGPYQLSRVQKGKFVEFSRKDDWWANDLKYFRNRFNPDKIRVRVIRDVNIAYQHFLKGDLDTFSLILPQYWHEKARGPLYDNGYIHKYWFHNQLPVPAAGMFINGADPLLASADVRYGIAHAMHFDRVIANVLRGDYSRMRAFQLGFGPYDNPRIEPRRFDVERAGRYFDQAGFSTRGADGIRVDGAGRRLSFRITYGQPHHTERLVVLQEEARKSGLELELQLLDAASSFKQLREKKHQIGWMTWNTQGLSPSYWDFFHSVNANKPQTNNIVNYADPEMDRLIMAYRDSAFREERVELAHRLEQMVYDTGLVIPTFQVPYTREAAWRWVKLPEGLGTRTSALLFNSQALSAGIFSTGGLLWIDAQEKEATLNAKDDGIAFAPTTVVNTDYGAM